MNRGGGTSGNLLRDELYQLIKEKALVKGEVILASGRKSSFYIDGKQVTLHPRGAYLAASLLLQLMGEAELDAVGGPSIGADPILGAMAVLCFQSGRDLTFFMVRKEPKTHGRRQLIEGPFPAEGARVALLEDVVTTGGSIIRAAEAVIRECGARVVLALAIVDREEGAREALERLGVPLLTIFRAREFLEPEF